MVQKKWSKEWKSSIQTRKQRKYTYNAPLHVKHKFVSATLSKELRTEYLMKSVPVRKGDTVKVLVGNSKGKSGKVTKVSLARTKVYVEGVDVTRADNTKSLYPIHPSNLMITKLDMNDKRRVEKIERVKNNKNGK